MNKTLAAVVFALMTPSITQAQAFQDGASAVEGLGLRACSDLVAAKKDDPALYRGFAIWLNGFLSAANAYEADTYDLTPWQPVEMSIAQIEKFCAANAERRMAEATVAYMAFLRADRLQEPSELVSVRNGEKGIFVYDAVLDRVRTKLRDLRLLGATEGQTFDATFGAAVLAYQTQNALPPTGLPDTPTLIHLLR